MRSLRRCLLLVFMQLFASKFISGLQCYDCNSARSEEECLTIKTCGIDQNVCYTEVRNDSLGSAQIMKSCYQAQACSTNRDQNDHSCPRSCALCCYGDLCNRKGPELCTCEILKLTTPTPPRSTTRSTFYPWRLLPKPDKGDGKAVVRDKQKRADVGITTTELFQHFNTTTSSTSTQHVTTGEQTSSHFPVSPTQATFNDNSPVVMTTAATTMTAIGCENFFDIPRDSPEIVCNNDNDVELVECNGAKQNINLLTSKTYYLANLTDNEWIQCRDESIPDDMDPEGGVEDSMDRSLSLTCKVAQKPSTQNHTGDNDVILDGIVSIYCDRATYTKTDTVDQRCGTATITCFMVFTPSVQPTETFTTTQNSWGVNTVRDNTEVPENATANVTSQTNGDAAAAEGNVGTASSGDLESWAVLLISLGCICTVGLISLLLFRLITRRGIYHVNRVAPAKDEEEPAEAENGKQDGGLPPITA